MDCLIDSAEDPRLADYARLTDPSFRMADEARRGYFVVESAQPVRVALGAVDPGRVRSVLVTPDQRSALGDVLVGLDASVFVAGREVLREIVGFDLHRGALAAVDRVPLPALQPVIADARLVAVGEGLVDHENLGALFRNAAAFGVDSVLLDPTCADPLYRRSVRVSIGHVLTVPWTRFDSWGEVIDVLRSTGFTVAALTPHADAVSIDEFATSAPPRIALLVGSEGSGLSATALDAADVRVRIPMRHAVDSVNVATAAAVAFHRFMRPKDSEGP